MQSSIVFLYVVFFRLLVAIYSVSALSIVCFVPILRRSGPPARLSNVQPTPLPRRTENGLLQ